MSSRFATERVVLAQDDLGYPSQRGSGLGCSGMAAWREGSDGLSATTFRRTCHGASSFGEVKQLVAHRMVYEDAKGELGWITTRAALPRAGTTSCPWCCLLRV